MLGHFGQNEQSPIGPPGIFFLSHSLAVLVLFFCLGVCALGQEVKSVVDD